MSTSELDRDRPSCRHILLVEDNEDGRETQRTLLELLGNQVEVAADGVEGVKKALAGHPNVAIVDIGLPGLDGYEVAKRIRAKLDGRVFLIAQTAYGGPVARRQALDAGFDVHLVKPVEVEELLHWLAVAGPTESNGEVSRTE
jgi:CheY-like chemotaxis protein